MLRASLGAMHEQLTSGEDVLALDLDPVLPVVRSQVEGVDASVAEQIPTDLAPITVLERDEAPALWEAVELHAARRRGSCRSSRWSCSPAPWRSR